MKIHRTFALTFVLSLLVALPLAAQWPVTEKLDLDAIYKIKEEGLQRSKVMEIESYLTDVYGPRLTGSPNYNEAADYAQEAHLVFACGRYEGFWEVALNPWDMAAGTLLVTEAGGRCSDMKGGVHGMKSPHLLTDNGAIHEETLALFGEIFGGRFREPMPII